MIPDVLESALEHSPESVSIYAIDGTVLFINPATERIMGTTLVELRGKRLFEEYPDAVGTAFHTTFLAVASDGEARQFQHYYPQFDGWFANHIVLSGDRIFVYAREVTDDVRRQRRLDAQNRISALVTRGELELAPIARAVADIMLDVLQADCTIAMLSDDGEWLDAVARASTDPATSHILESIPRWRATLGHQGEVLRTRRAVLETATRLKREEAPDLLAALDRYQLSSVVVAPLLVEDTPVGVLTASRRKGAAPLTEHDRTLLAEVAPSIALFLASANRRAEAATLRLRLTAMADVLPALVAFIDTHERYRYVNAAYERWFGLSTDQYVGMSMREMMGEEAYAVVEPYATKVLAGETVRFQARVAYRTGSRDVDAHYVPIKGADGAIDGFAVLVTDISNEVKIAEVERHHMDAQLRATARLERLLQLAARMTAARSYDDVARELVDGSLYALDAMSASLWEWLPDGTQRLRRRAGAADEGPGTPGASVLPLVTDGTASSLVLTFAAERQLSPDERAYLEILASHGAEALRRALVVEQSQRARAEAEAANRAKDEFLAMLGHELRNPLAPMVTAVELMGMRGDGTHERERTILGRQIQHLSRLVDDLLDVSRITRGKIELRREQLRISEIIAKAVEQTSPLFDERHHHLDLDIPVGLAVHGDSTRLAQVFANLLSNAAKYTPHGGRIVLTARGSGDQVTIRVRDNGIGIAPALLPHVFELFVQEKQSSERPAGGLGLGLTIVRSLVEQHGGTIRAESEGPGKGTELVVTLPAALGDAAPVAASSPRITKSPSARRVLVVDDNEDAAVMLAELLDACGHESRIAFDGPSALRIASEFHPEVAVLDIGLPVMDGYELAAQLRSRPGLADVRLIAVTGYGQESDRQRSLEAGFVAHLPKPVEIRTLVSLVEHR